ncbi:DUF3649 domain-containing protein [Pusillimonas sp. ANT_WB101]|nr:DUF3649 domain-containing protein [Pusillimonas sp. ANT_WB101]
MIVFRNFPLISRLAAAILGGYTLAALLSVAALALPVRSSEAALIGMTASFLVYAAAVIWVFAVRSATRAWGGLLVAAVLLLPVAAWVWYGGGA